MLPAAMRNKLFPALMTAVVMVTVSNGAKLQFESRDVTCPDAKSTCTGQSSTCCATADGGWACCPQKNAQCCSDGLHCCPEGTTCNAERGSCDPVFQNVTTPAVPKTPQPTAAVMSSSLHEPGAGMMCPDRHSQCTAPGAACCRHYSGAYTCCNYPLNVCCEDGIHCCHSGTVCDQLHLTCVPYPSTEGHSHDWQELVASRDLSTGLAVAASAVDQLEDTAAVNIVCPDGHTSCPSGNTCCQTHTGYGCCPFAYATCCPDMQHCCRHGYRCNRAGLCIRDGEENLPWASLKLVTQDETADSPAAAAELVQSQNKEPGLVICPDGSQCPTGQTCCRTPSGYGCCPYYLATCCADMQHCCRHGYRCAGTVCLREHGQLPWAPLEV